VWEPASFTSVQTNASVVSVLSEQMTRNPTACLEQYSRLDALGKKAKLQANVTD